MWLSCGLIACVSSTALTKLDWKPSGLPGDILISLALEGSDFDFDVVVEAPDMPEKPASFPAVPIVDDSPLPDPDARYNSISRSFEDAVGLMAIFSQADLNWHMRSYMTRVIEKEGIKLKHDNPADYILDDVIAFEQLVVDFHPFMTRYLTVPEQLHAYKVVCHHLRKYRQQRRAFEDAARLERLRLIYPKTAPPLETPLTVLGNQLVSDYLAYTQAVYEFVKVSTAPATSAAAPVHATSAAAQTVHAEPATSAAAQNVHAEPATSASAPVHAELATSAPAQTLPADLVSRAKEEFMRSLKEVAVTMDDSTRLEVTLSFFRRALIAVHPFRREIFVTANQASAYEKLTNDFRIMNMSPDSSKDAFIVTLRGFVKLMLLPSYEEATEKFRVTLHAIAKLPDFAFREQLGFISSLIDAKLGKPTEPHAPVDALQSFPKALADMYSYLFKFLNDQKLRNLATDVASSLRQARRGLGLVKKEDVDSVIRGYAIFLKKLQTFAVSYVEAEAISEFDAAVEGVKGLAHEDFKNHLLASIDVIGRFAQVTSTAPGALHHRITELDEKVSRLTPHAIKYSEDEEVSKAVANLVQERLAVVKSAETLAVTPEEFRKHHLHSYTKSMAAYMMHVEKFVALKVKGTKRKLSVPQLPEVKRSASFRAVQDHLGAERSSVKSDLPDHRTTPSPEEYSDDSFSSLLLD